MDTSIELDGVLTPSCTKYLISSFVKYILYQRGQIPFQFDSLKNYAKIPADKITPSVSNEVKDMDWCHDADGIRHHQQQLRESLRQERHARRKLRNDEKLRKIIETFLASYDQCDQHLSDTLDNCSWPCGVQVALLLGSSPISPKEVYVLHFPATEATFDRHPRCLQHRRGAVQLFRTLVTCSPLLELTARQLAPTNLHVLVHTAPGGHGWSPLVARPQLTFRRGTVIHIRLRHGAAALAEPVPPLAAVSPCCGRAAPRRLQPCCAQYAAEMGLTLLDVSLSPLPAARGARQSGPTSAAEWRSSPAAAGSVASPHLSHDSSSSSHRSSPTAGEELEARGDSPAATGSDGEPETEPMWCQIPVTLRGFRMPFAVARTGVDWLASTE